MFIFDAHLDLAMNALEWNRDLTRPIGEIRQREQALTDKPDRGRGTVCLPEMRHGGVGVCVATLIARYVKPGNPLPGWNSPAQAWSQTQGQLAWYRAMEEAGEMVQIKEAEQVRAHLALWGQSLPQHPEPEIPTDVVGSELDTSKLPVGYILSLEGADSVRSPAHLERAYHDGLRALGPAHYGPGIYAQGTDAEGGLGVKGRELLRVMEELGIILDVTHLCDQSFWEALEAFGGPIWASHSNCRALVPHHRQFSDEQIRHLVQRGAVIGVALDAWMLEPGWIRGHSTPEATGLTLDRAVEHIDRVCQIAGNASHSGIGSDLDGGFGREQAPMDLETIADLGRLATLLEKRGYTEADVARVMHGNFLRFLCEWLES